MPYLSYISKAWRYLLLPSSHDCSSPSHPPPCLHPSTSVAWLRHTSPHPFENVRNARSRRTWSLPHPILCGARPRRDLGHRSNRPSGPISSTDNMIVFPPPALAGESGRLVLRWRDRSQRYRETGPQGLRRWLWSRPTGSGARGWPGFRGRTRSRRAAAREWCGRRGCPARGWWCLWGA